MKIVLSSICLESGTDIQLALYYLKSYLLKRKSAEQYSPKVLIAVFDEHKTVQEIIKRISGLNPQVAGFSCYLWNIGKTLEVCRILKKANPGLKIILGGPEASALASEILKREKAVDLIVRGEGEESFAEVTQSIAGYGLQLSEIKGISFRQGKDIVINPDRPQMPDIEAIPSPYLQGVVNLKSKEIIDVPLETTRGCLYRCSYCYYHKNFPRVRFFPLFRIKKELQLILANKPHEVYLMDATFNSHLARAKKILRMFIRYNQGANLHVELMAELLDEEMARLLSQANAYNIEIGIQSTNPRTLKAINRRFNAEKFKRGIGLLNKYKLYYEIQLIDALPFQSYDSLKQSLDWLYQLHPAKVIIFREALLPGTQLRQQAARYGIVYGAKPPYYAVKSQAMSRQEIRRVEKLGNAMERLYDSQVFQPTLYALKDRGGIKISDMLEDWIIWEARVKQYGSRYLEFINKKLPGFLEYVCRKHKRLDLYKELLPILRKNLE